MKLISFTGAQGTSKTWYTRKIADDLILRGYQVTVVPSITRQLLSEGAITGHSQEATVDDQFLILDAYTRKYSDILHDKSDMIYIVDRSFSDISAYCKWQQLENLFKDPLVAVKYGNLKKMAETYFNYYASKSTAICYCAPYLSVDPDGVRVVDEGYQHRIDFLIRNLLLLPSTDVQKCIIYLSGDREKNLPALLSDIIKAVAV